ncbi:replication-relaxation family protein [Nocardia wallacei]|uniref:replication-relaxation family protein n=1 Tax=Nocardia wallacei TaxID=480035 RepID=UPI002453B654|nr:replication-relaxation family protein [Nocardia wallacei]
MNRSKGQDGHDATKGSGRFGGRFTSTDTVASSLVNGESGQATAPTDGAFGTISPPKRRVSQRDLDRIAASLSARDWEVLRSVASHRFLTVDQIRRLHFAGLSPTSNARLTQKALQRLRRDRLLGTLDRRIGGVGFGSSGLVHYIDVTGYRLLQHDDQSKVRRHVKEPTETFLHHTLAVAETHLRLVEADHRGELELAAWDIEPTWPRFIRLGSIVRLTPDLYAETALSPSSAYVDSYFIEVDMGTESIPRLIKKCHDYQAYERVGIGTGNHAPSDSDGEGEAGFPLVVWIMTHRNMATAERRRRALRDAITRDRRLDPTLLRIISPDQLIGLVQKGGGI